jgi:peptidoglycan/LPS O-acetylase OafA/YrhL
VYLRDAHPPAHEEHSAHIAAPWRRSRDAISRRVMTHAATAAASAADPAVVASVTAHPPDRLAALDALRGIAAVAVMLYHYTDHYNLIFHHPFRPYAWTAHLNDGVLLFFMISGFVIPASAARAPTVVHFLAARFARLYPAYWVAMLLTFSIMVAHPLAPFARFVADWKDVPANLTMFPCWLGYRAVDYSYWTLAFELCFYLMVAVIFALRLGNHLEAVCVVWLAAAVGYYLQVGGRPAVAWFAFLPAHWYTGLTVLQYASYFISGMMLYKIYRGAATPLTYMILGAAAVCMYLYNGPTVPFWNSMFFIVVLLFVGRIPWLGSGPLLWLGSISYCLYLIHQYIGYTVIYSAYQFGLPSAAAIPLAIAVSFTLAWLLRTWVEQPAAAVVRRAAYRRLDRWWGAASAARHNPIVTPPA